MLNNIISFFKKPFYNSHVRALLILAAMLVVFYRQVVFEGKTFLMEDTVSATLPSGSYGYSGEPVSIPYSRVADSGAIAWGYEPAIRLARDMLRQGEIPLWKAGSGLGSPFLADGMSLIIDPLLALTYLVPLRWWAASMDIVVLLRFLMGGFLVYLFARRISLSFFPSVFSGAAFMLSQQLVGAGNSPQLSAQILIPALLLCFDWLVDRPMLTSLTVTAITIAWTATCMTEPAFLALLMGGLWYAYRMFARLRGAKLDRAWVSSWIWGVAAVFIGLALSAWFWMPLLENIANSVTTHPGGQGLVTFSPFALLLLMLPPIRLNTMVPSFRTVVMTLGIAGLLVLPKASGKKARAVFFFAGYFFIFGLELFGVVPFKWIGYLPGFYQITIGHYMQTTVDLSVIYLAAWGLEYVFIAARGWLPLVLSGLIQGSIGLIFIQVIRTNLQDSWHQLAARLLIPFSLFLLTCLVVFLLIWLKKKGWIPAAILLIFLGEVLVTHAQNTWPERYYPYMQPPFISYLKKNKEPFRVVGLDGVLYPNVAMVYGIDDIRYLDAIDPLRRNLFLQTLIAPTKPKDRLAGVETPFGLSPILDLLNVRYILAMNVARAPGEAPLSSQYSLIYDNEVKIFKNPHVMPRAFILYQVEQVNDLQGALAKLSNPSFDLHNTAVIEKAFWPEVTGLPAKVFYPWKAAQVTQRSANSLDLKVESDRPGILVISETYFPGWQAYLQGKPVPIFPVDGMLRGVAIPAGSSQVSLVYQPLSFIFGSALGLVTALALLTIWGLKLIKSNSTKRVSKINLYS